MSEANLVSWKQECRASLLCSTRTRGAPKFHSGSEPGTVHGQRTAMARARGMQPLYFRAVSATGMGQFPAADLSSLAETAAKRPQGPGRRR